MNNNYVTKEIIDSGRFFGQYFSGENDRRRIKWDNNKSVKWAKLMDLVIVTIIRSISVIFLI